MEEEISQLKSINELKSDGTGHSFSFKNRLNFTNKPDRSSIL